MEPRITLNGERKSAAQHRGLTTSSSGSPFCLLLAIRPGTSELSKPPLSHLCTGGTRSAPSLRPSRARKAGARGVQGGWAQPGLRRRSLGSRRAPSPCSLAPFPHVAVSPGRGSFLPALPSTPQRAGPTCGFGAGPGVWLRWSCSALSCFSGMNVVGSLSPGGWGGAGWQRIRMCGGKRPVSSVTCS